MTPVLVAFSLCPVAAALAPADISAPLSRAATLAGWERSLGLPSESAITAWLQARPVLAQAARLFYLWVHLPVTVGVLVWVWLERRPAFPRVRDTFVVAQLLTVAAYLVLPTAPPWMLEGGGDRAVPAAAHVLQSPVAAMPSGHMAFAAFAAGTICALVRHPLIRLAAVAYAALVLAVIVATANHWWLDGAGGAAAAAAGAGLARR